MKEIILIRGQVALVDDEDFEMLSKYNWHTVRQKTRHTDYAAYSINRNDGKVRKQFFMHRLILNVPPGKIVDHINRNGLDNRRENLRICTIAENVRNAKLSIANTTGYKGVHFDKRTNGTKKWVAAIGFQGKSIRLGAFTLKEDAALAYNKAAKELFGEFASLNKIICGKIHD